MDMPTMFGSRRTGKVRCPFEPLLVVFLGFVVVVV